MKFYLKSISLYAALVNKLLDSFPTNLQQTYRVGQRRSSSWNLHHFESKQLLNQKLPKIRFYSQIRKFYVIRNWVRYSLLSSLQMVLTAYLKNAGSNCICNLFMLKLLCMKNYAKKFNRVWNILIRHSKISFYDTAFRSILYSTCACMGSRSSLAYSKSKVSKPAAWTLAKGSKDVGLDKVKWYQCV